MNMKWKLKLAVMMLMAVGMAGARLSAQVETSPGVARMSLIHGDVSTERGDTGTWAAAAINAPLVTGDSVSTGGVSRAEVQLDYANVLRLGEHTEAKIADLSSGHIQVQLAQGLADYTVLKGNQAGLEIDTPNVAVHPTEPGIYRIEVFSNSRATVIVRKGNAQVSTPQGSTTVKNGELMRIEGAENPQYQIVGAPKTDAWDQWNDQRNHLIEDARSYQYTNQYYTGAEDLDAYGHWVNVPGYNWCWTPYVDAGWIPYYDGRWAWEPYYGWTWVSAEPWGWAPYHYGRWFNYGGSWCWWPGPVTPFYNPIWAPAYVSFFGFGGRFGVGVGFGFGGFGSIGWLPIGPCDPFFPWYGGRRGFGYGRGFGYNAVNITNIRNVTNITNVRNINSLTRNGALPYVAPLAGRGRPVYSNLRGAVANAHVRRAIVAVPARDFAAGRVLHARTAVLSQSALERGQLVSGRVPVIPTRASLNPSGRAASRAALPPAAVNNRRFFTVRQPAARPQTFNRQVAGIRQELSASRPSSFASRSTLNTRQPVNTAARQMSSAGAVRGTSSLKNTNRTPASNAWQSFRSSRSGPAPFSRPSNQNARPGSLGASSATGNVRSNGFAKQQARPQSFTARSAARGATAGSGWQRFSNSAARTPGSNRSNSGRAYNSSSFGNRQGPQNRASGFNRPAPVNRGANGWQRFSAQPRQQPNNRGFSNSAPASHSYGGWPSRSSAGYSRPDLNLQRPIVTSRSSGSGGYRGSWSRGYTHTSGPSRGGGGYHGGGSGGAVRSAPASHGRR